MVRNSIVFLLASTACLQAQAVEAHCSAPDIFAMSEQARRDYVAGSMANGREGVRQLARRLKALDKKELAYLQLAARDVLTVCPYNRATFELVESIREVSKVLPTVGKNERAARLARAKDTIDQLGVVCDMLLVGEALDAVAERTPTDAAPNSAKAHSAAMDRLATVHQSLFGVTKKVAQLSPAMRDFLDMRQRVLNEGTGELWNVKPLLIKLRGELQTAYREGDSALRSGREAPQQAEIQAIINAISAQMIRSC